MRSCMRTVKSVIQELMQSQAEDGYLGPFPKEERLLKYWDLWGHYHVMLALLMWHEQTGDAAALEACRKAADLVCRTYLDTGRRPREAGSTEMNLAIIHALGRLYRTTKEERYLQMMRVIEEDWELEGDYFRTGLAGVEFYRIPKPRWESLPDLQGLLELFLITGDERYRTAFLHHWDSIRRLDRRNTGGFSSGEQATGTPYEPTAIETCCTIAWMALTVDALRATGSPAGRGRTGALHLQRHARRTASVRELVDLQHAHERRAGSVASHDRVSVACRDAGLELLQRQRTARPGHARRMGRHAGQRRVGGELLRPAWRAVSSWPMARP